MGAPDSCDGLNNSTRHSSQDDHINEKNLRIVSVKMDGFT